ncbi:phage tail protein [Enterobacter ludwigii]|uniref:phage tail protein n=1 Tax=Enterobacter ludwigii TaxID=299767 RepID=UPI0006437454|nr:phage tail protein [Enterobacter ludwigii]KLP41775.1 hypothetical protein ABR36_08000 [Enterobacter ludwigii]
MSEKRTSQLDQLTDFVMGNLPDWACKNRSALFAAFAAEQTILSVKRDLGLGIQIGITRYEAVLSWERFPYRKIDPGIVYALVTAWLEEHSNELRDQLELKNEPDIDIEIIDDDNAVFAISVVVAEPLSLMEDPNGPVPFRGKRWRVDAVPVWTAERAYLYVNDMPVAEIDGE